MIESTMRSEFQMLHKCGGKFLTVHALQSARPGLLGVISAHRKLRLDLGLKWKVQARLALGRPPASGRSRWPNVKFLGSIWSTGALQCQCYSSVLLAMTVAMSVGVGGERSHTELEYAASWT